MRSFLISIPPGATPTNVLIFLHGVGEAFMPFPEQDRQTLNSTKPGELLTKPGVQNVLNHGVPMILARPGEHAAHEAKDLQHLPFSLPLFSEFVVIAPQLFLREGMADANTFDSMMNEANQLARAIVREPKIALMGFSRGGYAAINLSRRDEVRVIVTMDAAARQDDLPAFVKTMTEIKKPFWAFFADYEDCDQDFRDRITAVHRQLSGETVSLDTVPNGSRCKTMIPTAGTRTSRHTQVCDLVSGSHVLYEWILQKLH